MGKKDPTAVRQFIGTDEDVQSLILWVSQNGGAAVWVAARAPWRDPTPGSDAEHSGWPEMIRIRTVTGTQEALRNDWICKDVEGNFHVMKEI